MSTIQRVLAVPFVGLFDVCDESRRHQSVIIVYITSIKCSSFIKLTFRYIPDLATPNATISGAALGQLSALTSITMYGTALISSLPTEIGRLTSLVAL
jgi:hypothetical protein